MNKTKTLNHQTKHKDYANVIEHNLRMNIGDVQKTMGAAAASEVRTAGKRGEVELVVLGSKRQRGGWAVRGGKKSRE
jgi:hypothetical protein